VLLQELIARVSVHVKAKPHEVLAVALWTLMSWVHEEAAHYSVYLVATAPKDDCGKTTLIVEVVGRLAPKSYASSSDPTVASIFRIADREKPTMLFDNVDTLFQRKPEVVELFLNGWTRGIKYSRVEKIGGDWQTVWYDPFCAKACSLIGTNLPRPLLGRCLLIELWPLKPGEEVVEVKPFDQELMDAFKTLRRKALRWSSDNASTLKTAEPSFPAGFTTRPRANAKLLLAIAELAGGDWPNQARDALDKLLREKREPSWLDLLLEELWTVFVVKNQPHIRSAALVKRLTADPTSEWREYGRGHRHRARSGGPASQAAHPPESHRQAAASRLSPPGFSRKRDFPAFPGSRPGFVHPLARCGRQPQEEPQEPQEGERMSGCRGQNDGQRQKSKIRRNPAARRRDPLIRSPRQNDDETHLDDHDRAHGRRPASQMPHGG
jgi:putative DNA primase/helicase